LKSDKDARNLLKGDKMSVRFGGLWAVRDVDFSIREHEILGLIGPNGAGKTTLFNAISGFYKPTSGYLVFNGKNLVGLSPHEICKMGISRTFQIVRPFLNISVIENVVISGLYGRSNVTSFDAAQSEGLKRLDFVGLSGVKDRLVRELTLFDRKRVEMATALNANPKLLLLDEPLAGLNPSEMLQAIELIRRIKNEMGITVFWIEHVMKAIMQVAERIMVLHHGEKISEGTTKEVCEDPKVVDAYLGEKYLL
jgi:branched-chain amino acid transport system ATP-binding protein